MALSTSVTPSDVAVALGQGAPASGSVQEQQWAMWITDALMLIQIRADELSVTTIDQSRLDYVIREAVVSHVRNPDDATQVTVAVDDGSMSKSYRSSKGRVSILDEWWTLLGLSPEGGQAFAVDTVGLGSSVHLPWCNIMFGAAYCSCGADIGMRPFYENAPGL